MDKIILENYAMGEQFMRWPSEFFGSRGAEIHEITKMLVLQAIR